MTRRSTLSATLAVEIGDWRAGAVAAASAAMVFAAYCQAHGWLESSSVPIDASLRWGILAGAPAGGLAWLFWSARRRVAAFAARGAGSAAMAIGGLFILVLIGGSVSHLIASQGELDDVARQILDEAFDLIPLATALAAGSFALLVAIRRARPPIGPSYDVPEWLMLPEAPDLRLRTVDVAAIRSAGNYCELQTATRAYLVRAPIKVLAERLGHAGFVRVHRSALVNLRRLLAVDRAAGQIRARLDDGSVMPVGSVYRVGLEAVLAARSSLGTAIRP